MRNRDYQWFETASKIDLFTLASQQIHEPSGCCDDYVCTLFCKLFNILNHCMGTTNQLKMC